VKYDIPYSSITSVREVKDVTQYWFSTTASSVYSLEIMYGKGEQANVSPLDKEEFISELRTKLKDPDICRTGEGQTISATATSVWSAKFDSEEAQSLGILSQRIFFVLLAAAIGITMGLIFVYDTDRSVYLFMFPVAMYSAVVNYLIFRQAGKVQQEMDKHDVISAKAKLRKGRVIGLTLLITSLFLMFFLAALIVWY